jgi:hypothetical protein
MPLRFSWFDLPIFAGKRSPTRQRGRIAQPPSLARRASMATTCENPRNGMGSGHLMAVCDNIRD